MLAADAAGAWLVGVDERGRSYLTRVFSGPRGKREYRLEHEPRAVAVGYGAVWVVTRGARDNQVLRIDPATGDVTKRTRFPTSSPIDGLAAGLGSVWVVASSSATLYRINPHSARVTGRIDLGERAARPEMVLGSIWVGLSDSGGDTVIVDPRTLDVVEHLGCCSPERGYDTVGHGSIWTYDTPTGTVVRWDGQTHQGAFNIHVSGSAVLRRVVPDLDRSRCRCRLGDGRRKRQLRLLSGRLQRSLPQPTLSPPSVPAATLAPDVVV